MKTDGDNQTNSAKVSSSVPDDRIRSIAYSMDALVPGLYLWCGSVAIRFGGSLAEANHPGTIHSAAGIALVLPGYRIYSTYQGSYDSLTN